MSTTPDKQPLLSDIESSLPEEESWDSLKRQAYQVENEVEQKLAKAGNEVKKILSKSHRPSFSEESPEQFVEQAKCKLNDLENVIEKMSACLERPSSVPTNPKQTYALDRLRNHKIDYEKDIRRVMNDIRAARDRTQLLDQVNDEIRSEAEGDSFLMERIRINGSHGMVNDILRQAHASREEIIRQGQRIRGFNARVFSAIDRIPAVNKIIGKINTRRKRDTLIMTGVISMCIILIILYWMRT